MYNMTKCDFDIRTKRQKISNIILLLTYCKKYWNISDMRVRACMRVVVRPSVRLCVCPFL